MVYSTVAFKIAGFLFGGSVSKRAAVIGFSAALAVVVGTGFYIKGRMAQNHKIYVQSLERTIRGQALAIETSTAASKANQEAALKYKEKANQAQQALEATGTAGNICFDEHGANSLRKLWGD